MHLRIYNRITLVINCSYPHSYNISMKELLLLIGLCAGFNSQTIFAGNPIDIADNTITVGGSAEEVVFYGFAAGDELIFSFEETNGKELNEIEIIEMPTSSLFIANKIKKLKNKVIHIQRTGIYKFRFANAASSETKICKFKIQRVPGSAETSDFNWEVYTKQVKDTSYVTQMEKYVALSDTSVAVLADQTAKIQSATNAAGNKTTYNFVLPEGTIAWSYYIGVDKAGQDVYQKAVKEFSKNPTKTTSGFVLSPLTAVALNIPSSLITLQGNKGVLYNIFNEYQPNQLATSSATRLIKTGNVVNDFSKMDPMKGNLFLQLQNNNSAPAISVVVKIEAVVVTQVWGTKPVQQMKITPREQMYLQQ